MKNRQQYIAISVIWFEAFKDCRQAEAFNPGAFPDIVRSFYDSLLDITKYDPNAEDEADNKLAIKTLVDIYYFNEWQPQVDKVFNERLKRAFSETEGKKAQIRNDVENLFIKDLYKKIIQVIQDSGIGWPTEDEYKNYMISQD